MAMVSELVGREVHDGDGRRATLVDLFVDRLDASLLAAGVLPDVLFFMLKLSGDPRLKGSLLNAPRLKLVARTTAIIVSALAITMLVNLGAEAVGVDLFGALRG